MKRESCVVVVVVVAVAAVVVRVALSRFFFVLLCLVEVCVFAIVRVLVLLCGGCGGGVSNIISNTNHIINRSSGGQS